MQNSLEQKPEINSTDRKPVNMKWIIIGVVVVLSLFVFRTVFSPENMAERIIEQAANGDYDVDINKDGSVKIVGGEGEKINMTTGKSATLPDGWPSSVPLLSDAKIGYSAVVNETEGGANFTVTYETSREITEVVTFYKEELVAKGWKIEAVVATGDGSMLSASNDEDESVVINVGPADGVSTVIISTQTKQ
ncbi:MAG: hypothetical protein RLZZ230_177 [Candidatus Parcubacteria bacterium]|jgi:hypothetical protein